MNYINQAPKEFNAQSAVFRKLYGNVNSLVYDGSPWLVQPKYDGVHIMVHTEGDGYARTRTGEAVLSVPHIIEQAKAQVGPGQVLFCESYLFGEHHKAVNGMVRRKTPQPNLLAIVYDIVPQTCFDEGFDPTPYSERFRVLQPIWCPNIMPVPMHNLPDGVTVQEYALALTKLPDAYDGAIIRDVTARWRRGAAKYGEVIKVKPSLTLDLQVVGSYADNRDTKLGGYLTVSYNGVPSDVGSGLTQAMLREIMEYEDRYVGQVAEVECLGVNPSGKLREPRFKGFRFDTVHEELKE